MRSLSDVLIVGFDTSSEKLIEQSISAFKLRYKFAADLGKALEWLNLRKFGLIILNDTLGLSNLQKLTTQIWDSSSEVRVVLVGLKGSIDIQCLLLGSEIVLGSDYVAELNRIFSEQSDLASVTNAPTHILLVEDLDSPREIISMFLEGLGQHKVTAVASVAEALKLLNEEPLNYTTVITDIKMPKQSGIDLIHAIRRSSEHARLPVIALTAYGTVDCLLECLEAGVSGFLVKPPKKMDLKRELRRAERIRFSGVSARLVRPERIGEVYLASLNFDRD